MSYSRRDLVARLGAALCLGGMSHARASEPSLEVDQGIVICSWRSDLYSHYLRFRQFHSRLTFSITADAYGEPPTPAVAQAGRYYLFSHGQPFRNVSNPIFPEPRDERGTFQVLNGAVNYLGDWDLRTSRAQEMSSASAKVTIDHASIFYAKRAYPWLEKYQLFVSVPGRDSYALSWTQVREPAPTMAR